MKKIIITTTINSPTIATKKFAEIAKRDDWTLVVVGDTKTPHSEYEKINCVYLSPEKQENINKELSDTIGWRSIQRRNLGLVFAYQQGADIVATIDDDNIPYDNWGQNVVVGQEIECDLYSPNNNVFDPLSVTNTTQIWHRGYPIELLGQRHEVEYKGKTKRKVLVQADLWDGDPDIDAMARLTMKPIVKYNIGQPYCSNRIAPFNSQNTFLAREVIPYYTVLPHVGRMDDIWGSYILQHYFPDSVIYNKASVYQDRNVQDLITNLEKEIIGYRNTYKLINDLENFMNYLPEETQKFYQTYRKCFV
tara:strand:- start:3107 stop:4024 length:918 start_codon:yes stop_codon:yes gene_type:complete